jgi:hypothetical protein
LRERRGSAIEVSLHAIGPSSQGNPAAAASRHATVQNSINSATLMLLISASHQHIIISFVFQPSLSAHVI